MTPERYERLGELYHAALEVEPQTRAIFLGAACGSDEELRREVEFLLAAHNKVGNYFAAPALEVAAGLVVKQENLSLMGQSFSHYRVLSLIGAGGMGEVYLAEDTRLGRKVALKMLPREFTQDKERVKRFEQEARAASALNHPNIVTIYEVGQVDGRQFIATEYIEGETLRGRLRDGQIELREVVEVGAQMASALQAAHEAGIVHRDIKPENVMVRRDGLVKVLDFGLAKLAECKPHSTGSGVTTQVDTETSPGLVLGTLSYMSPEQARGERLDERTDIFSLGVVVYEMVAGQSPFAAASAAETLAAILEREPTPLAGFVQDAPVDIQQIVMKALRKDRDERYQTARELAIDLKSLKQEIEVEARLKKSPEPETDSGRLQTGNGGPAAFETIQGSVATTDDVATARPTSTGGYRVVEDRRGSALEASRWANRSARWTLRFAVFALLALTTAIIFFWAVKKPKSSTSDVPVKSIAVLPFKPLSADSRNEPLELGMADTLINKLSGIRQLIVRPMSSVRKYTALEQDSIAAGRELGVDYVLEGNFQMDGEKTRATVRLLSVKDGAAVWTDKCDKQCATIFELQDAITERIASGLEIELSSEERKRTANHYTDSTEAYHAYLKGRVLHHKRTLESTVKGIEYFEQATKLDPDYALAYVALADAQLSLTRGGWRSTDEVMPQAKAAVAKALEIDDKLAEAHAAKGSIRFFEWDWSGAEREFKRAIELNPNYERNHSDYDHCLRVMKRFDEAVAESKRALELEPASAFHHRGVAMALYYARRYDEAIEQSQRALELDTNLPTSYRWLGKSFEQKKLYDQAVEAYLKTGECTEHGPEAVAALRAAYTTSGWKGFWRKLLDLKKEREKRTNVRRSDFAETYARLGEKDQAFAWLEKSYEQRQQMMSFLSRDPIWDDLRSDPRYAHLLRRMGLEP